MKVSDYDRITEEYKSNIRKLQSTCSHKRISGWMAQWWAIGHSTGYIVRVCENCNKTVDKKRGVGRHRREEVERNERGIKIAEKRQLKHGGKSEKNKRRIRYGEIR